MPLNPDEAWRQLQQQALEDGLERAQERVRRLQGERREVADGLLQLARPHVQRPPRGTREMVGTWLDGASDEARRELFVTMHPRVGALLAAMWPAMVDDPYPSGQDRRPFRAPHDLAISRRVRTKRLSRLLDVLIDHEQPVAWFAAWAGHLPAWDPDRVLGRFLGVALTEGDTQVREVLHATAGGEHPIGSLSHDTFVALLTSLDPGDHDVVIGLLRAAGRQEGLRSAVLESVDLAQPAAFRRVLDVVREDGLTRFASVARAVGTWFGVGFEVRDRATIDATLAATATFLQAPGTRQTALAGDDPSRVQLALWASAFEDGPATLPSAAALLASDDADVQRAAANVLADLQLDAAALTLLPRFEGGDRRLAALAHRAVRRTRGRLSLDQLEPPVRALLADLATPTPVDVGVLRSEETVLDPRQVARSLVDAATVDDVGRIDDLVDRLDVEGRLELVRLLATAPEHGREQLLGRLGDRSPFVHDEAFAALRAGRPLTPDEAPRVEALLRRSTASLRRGALGLLLRQPTDGALAASARRLLAGTELQRAGAVELLHERLRRGRGDHEAISSAGEVTSSPLEVAAWASEVAALAREVAADPAVAASDRKRLTVALDAEAGERGATGNEEDADGGGVAGGTGGTGGVGAVGGAGVVGLGPGSLAALPDRADRTSPRPLPVTALDTDRWRPGVERVLTSLDAWITEHRDVEVATVDHEGPTTVLLADLTFLPAPRARIAWERQADEAPLHELVDPWWERTRHQLGDGGMEVALAWIAMEISTTHDLWYGWPGSPGPPDWVAPVVEQLVPASTVDRLTYGQLIHALLPWQALRAARPTWLPQLFAVAEAAVVAVPEQVRLAGIPESAERFHDLAADWREHAATTPLAVLNDLEAVRPELFDVPARARLWRLVRYVDEPVAQPVAEPVAQPVAEPAADHADGGAEPVAEPAADQGADHADGGADDAAGAGTTTRRWRRHPPLDLTVRAIEDGTATHADLVDLLLVERGWNDRPSPTAVATLWEDPLNGLTARRRHQLLTAHPWLAEVVDEVRDHLVAAELLRGELPTPTSGAANQLASVPGAAAVVRLLAALGRRGFARGWAGVFGTHTAETLSHLIRVSFPAPDDTPASFAAAASDAGLRDGRLLELAVYAPQWAPFVEFAVGWDGLAGAVHWLHAHTKDDRWYVDEAIRTEWAAVVAERTPLSADELTRGEVDVPWFERTVARLGPDRFDRVLKVAKLASGGGGHKRAELFARALRGDLDRVALETRIGEKRHQDSVRALGLLPLPDDEEARAADVLARYERLQQWRRGSAAFGAQRRASEATAVEVALANLARTAGYPDPQRLTWAMEAEAVRDLAAGPVVVVEDDVTVALALDVEGAPELTIRRGERVLKGVPKAVAKRPAVVGLKARVTELREQTRRMRTSLELGMVRGDTFTAGELAALLAHPSLAPMLRRLVFVAEPAGLAGEPVIGVGGERVVGVGDDGLGRLGSDATSLIDVDGAEVAVGDRHLRIAHPTDLLASGVWDRWQRRLFVEEVRQPFKQVFRELYVPTAAERDGVTRSGRYAGHQLEARRAAALFGARGWVLDRDMGAVRTFHAEGVTVRAEVLQGFLTAAEAADPMLEAVAFFHAATERLLPIDEVPPRLFSEAMRDVDLVVSVAHSGGVDPEVSTSTVAMRGALVEETAELLGFDNVEVTDNHALISGTLGTYSVHLGSGTVHRRPGNAVCIIPVGAQHRGRLFLPFVDDDPRTAEVVSKVVLLARDEEIKDPSILAQLRS